MVEGTFSFFVVLASIWVIALLCVELFAPVITAEVIPQSVSRPLIGSSRSSTRRLIDGHILIETPLGFRVAPGHPLVLTMRRSIVPGYSTVLAAVDPATHQAFASNTAFLAATTAAATIIFGLVCFASELLQRGESSVMVRAWALLLLFAVVTVLHVKRHIDMRPLRKSVSALGLLNGTNQ